MRQKIFFFLVSTLITSLAYSQMGMPADTVDYEKQYQERIGKSHINGFYIPTDINDAMLTMDEVMDESVRKKFGYLPEDEVAKKTFFSVGTWMGLNWGLYEGSRLSVWFHQVGAKHPDDMIWVLLRSYHRHLNGRELNYQVLIEEYNEARKEKK